MSFETELLIEFELLSELFNELLSGSAVSTVGVDDSSETPTINCVVEETWVNIKFIQNV